jgi:nitrogen PTS system EIIA component
MLLTAGSAAKLLGTSERQIYRWVDDGEIPCRRVRDQLRFNRTDLLEWASSRRMPVHVEAFAEDDPEERPPSLSDALRLGRVHDGIEANNREELVRAIVERTLPASADRELVVEVLLARHSAGLTAIGSGLAIPQVRNPLVVAGQAPLVAICHLATPLLIGASPDGLPIRTLFVAVSPTIRCHLQLLARLSRALADVDFRAAAKSLAPLEELIRHAARVEAELPREVIDEGDETE